MKWLCLTLVVLGCTPIRAGKTTRVDQLPPSPPMFSPVTKAASMPHQAAYPAPPPSKTNVLLSWSFPKEQETPETVFKVRHSRNIAVPLSLWPLVTNIPGTNRSVLLRQLYPWDFYTLTASNRYGETYAIK